MEKVVNHIKSKSNKQIVIVFSSLLIIALFHIPIEILLSETVVKYIFSYVKVSFFNDVIFLIITFVIFSLTISKKKKYIPSKNVTAIIIALTVVYFFYRFVFVFWELHSFSITNSVKYLDIIFVLASSQMFLIIKSRKKDLGENQKIVDSTPSFFMDEPILNEADDLLGYNTYVTELANLINHTTFTKSFAIGINGKWGSGKSSFTNLLKPKLSKENIEIHFNPWASNSPTSIIQDFFESFQKSISPYHSELSKTLNLYSRKLTILEEEKLSKLIQTSLQFVNNDILSDFYQTINSELELINKTIIVYIDDLDRLDKLEILEVLKLIRNSANFHKTVFIVSYDRDYVINAIKHHNDYGESQFLEKIFQIEVSLPYYPTKILCDRLVVNLKANYPVSEHEMIEKVIIGMLIEQGDTLKEWIVNMRGVIQLSNSLTLNYSRLKNEVLFEDILKLELLRIKFPTVYEALGKFKGKYLEPGVGISSTKSQLVLKKSKEEGITELEIYLKSLNLDAIETNRIKRYINQLFSINRTFVNQDKHFLSLVYPSKFNRYFTYGLVDSNLSEIEFSNAKELDQNSFNEQISSWVGKGLEFELRARFLEIQFFDNHEDYEKIIRAIFHFALLKPTSETFRHFISYDLFDLYVKIVNYHSVLENRTSNTSDVAVIREILTNASSPYTFESSFIQVVLTNDLDDNQFPLRRNELLTLNESYLKRYAKSINKIDLKLIALFENCSTEPENFYKRRSDNAKVIFKEFILEQDLDGFIRYCIQKKTHSTNLYSIDNICLEIFDNWKNLLQFLNDADDSKYEYLIVFKSLINEYKKNDYRGYIYLELPTNFNNPPSN